MASRETENNAYAKFWGDKQRTLWYVMVFLEWSIGIGFNGIACILDILLDCSQSLFFRKIFGIDHLPLQATTMASNVRI